MSLSVFYDRDKLFLASQIYKNCRIIQKCRSYFDNFKYLKYLKMEITLINLNTLRNYIWIVSFEIVLVAAEINLNCKFLYHFATYCIDCVGVSQAI